MHIIETLYELLVDFNLVVAKVDCQIAKFNSPPNFLAIQQFHHLPPQPPPPTPNLTMTSLNQLLGFNLSKGSREIILTMTIHHYRPSQITEGI